MRFVRTHPVLTALALCMVALGVGVLDWVTGPELSLAVLYLVPITLAAWHLGRRPALIVSLVSIVSWFLAARLSGDPSPLLVLDWNALVLLVFFVVVSHVVSALRASRDLQEQLLEFIVHDLRSPLITIQLSLDPIRQRPDSVSEDQVRQRASMALGAAGAMRTLVDSLLDLPRLSQHKMPIQPVDISVADLVGDTVNQLVGTTKEVTVAYDLGRAVTTVYADPEITRRILVNILGNAMKHSPPHSTVRVSAVPYGPSRVAITVADNGPGVPKEWVKRVFEKFAQVEARKAGGAVGSGLGLTFCRVAVEAQGGDIWMESELGAGTSVTFTLPVSGTSARPGNTRSAP